MHVIQAESIRLVLPHRRRKHIAVVPGDRHPRSTPNPRTSTSPSHPPRCPRRSALPDRPRDSSESSSPPGTHTPTPPPSATDTAVPPSARRRSDKHCGRRVCRPADFPHRTGQAGTAAELGFELARGVRILHVRLESLTYAWVAAGSPGRAVGCRTLNPLLLPFLSVSPPARRPLCRSTRRTGRSPARNSPSCVRTRSKRPPGCLAGGSRLGRL